MMADRYFTRTTTARPAALSLSVTVIYDAHKPPPPPPRRHLAPNVVCLFAADRPAVTNERRRGRLPRGVTRLWIPPLSVGQVCEIRHRAPHPNNGKVVKLLRYFDVHDGYDVEAITGTLHVFEPNMEPAGQDKAAFIRVRNLRRIANHPR